MGQGSSCVSCLQAEAVLSRWHGGGPLPAEGGAGDYELHCGSATRLCFLVRQTPLFRLWETQMTCLRLFKAAFYNQYTQHYESEGNAGDLRQHGRLGSLRGPSLLSGSGYVHYTVLAAYAKCFYNIEKEWRGQG